MRQKGIQDSCTTILVGKKASYDGSTMIARTEDSQNGVFTPKKFIVVNPEDQPRHYKSVLSSFEIDLPDNPVRYTSVPDALAKDGIWGEAGINVYNVAMSETETITTNSRVLGADPLVATGIGEEDMLTLVLPYIKTAREGVLRLGKILEEYGTYESNGIAFSDVDEICAMLLVASVTKTAITIHHVLGIFSVFSIQKLNKTRAPFSFLGVKNPTVKSRLKMSSMSLAAITKTLLMTLMA